MIEATEKPGSILSEDNNQKPQPSAGGESRKPGSILNVPKIKLVDLGDLGANLALGVPNADGVYQRTIQTRRWNLTKENEIEAKRRRKGKGAHSMYSWVTMLLSEMCPVLGPHNLENMTEAERILAINGLHFGDVLTAYSWLRRDALGEELKLQVKCPECGFEFPYPTDLNTLPIRTAESVEDTRWIYVPHHPFEIRGQTVQEFEMGSMLWSSLSGTKPEHGATKAEALHSSIFKINSREVNLTKEELGEMSKRDIESMLAAIERFAIGPDLALEVTCKDARCEAEFRSQLDWGYDSFFSTSSP